MTEMYRFVNGFRGVVGNYYDGADRESCFLTVAERLEDGTCAYSTYSAGNVSVTLNAVSRVLGEIIGRTVRNRERLSETVSKISLMIMQSALAAMDKLDRTGSSAGGDAEEE